MTLLKQPCILIEQINWVLSNSDFLIPISLQPDVVELWYVTFELCPDQIALL